MKLRKLNIIALTILLSLFGVIIFSEQKTAASVKSVKASDGCEGLPEQVSTLMDEWEQAGVKSDCTVNQIMNWTVNHAQNKTNMGAVMTDAMRFLRALGYEAAQGPPIYSQAHFDSWRKKENGVSSAFVNWKGSTATVIYMPEIKNYLLVQYREVKAKPVSGFHVNIEYDQNSRFSAEDKQKIEEAVGWWKAHIADNFEITLDFHLDPSISAGGTTLVGDVPRSCIDHQPAYAEIKLKEVNTSLVSHEIGHALGIGTAAIFKKNNVCGKLAEVAKDINSIELSSARIENDRFFGKISQGVLLVKDREGDYGHVSSDEKDDEGHPSAVQPSLGGKPSIKDFRILEDLGYELKFD